MPCWEPVSEPQLVSQSIPTQSLQCADLPRGSGRAERQPGVGGGSRQDGQNELEKIPNPADGPRLS